MKYRRLLLCALLLFVALVPLAAVAQSQEQRLPLIMRNHDSGAPTPIPPPPTALAPTATVTTMPTTTETVAATATTQPTATVTVAPSITGTASATVTGTTSPTATVTGTAAATVTGTTSPTATGTITVTSIPTGTVTATPGASPSPTVSPTTTPAPDENALAYYSVNTMPTPPTPMVVNLYVADVRTGIMKRYTRVTDYVEPDMWRLGRSSWSPESSLVAFASDLDLKVDPDYGGDWTAYALVPVTGSDTGKLQVLVKDTVTGTDFIHPAWSPDGSTVAFVSNRDGPADDFDIFIKRVGETALVNLTSDQDGDQLYPIWSPDGAHILYQNVLGTTRQVYVMDADGSNRHPLLPAGDYRDFAWSSDGSTIAFATDRDGDWDVYTIAASALDLSSSTNDLNGAKNLTDDNPGEDRCPSWSPPSALYSPLPRIAFASQREFENVTDIHPQIYTVDSDGSHLARFTWDANFIHYCPSWSPK
ncbi:MAG: hypothetical protein HPY83_03185 [Anaerolineae bacterium]|nr:hypothetical protein [Anaerolineae bacterium]